MTKDFRMGARRSGFNYRTEMHGLLVTLRELSSSNQKVSRATDTTA